MRSENGVKRIKCLLSSWISKWIMITSIKAYPDFVMKVMDFDEKMKDMDLTSKNE